MALHKEVLKKSLPSALPPRGFLQPRRYAVCSSYTYAASLIFNLQSAVQIYVRRREIVYVQWVLQLELLNCLPLVVIMLALRLVLHL